jgi:hypothetical protein
VACSPTQQADWPAEVREPLIDYHVSPRGLKVGFQEASNVDQLYAEIRTAGPLPEVPLLILSSTRSTRSKPLSHKASPNRCCTRR